MVYKEHEPKYTDGRTVWQPRLEKDDQIREAAMRFLRVTGVLYREIKPERVDSEMTVSLTKKARELINSDDLLVLAFKDGDNSMCDGLTHKFRIGARMAGRYGNRHDIREFGVRVDCAKAARVLAAAMTDETLADLKDGVRLILYHEIGHLKLKEYGKAFKEGTGGDKTLNELYGIPKRGDGETAPSDIEALAHLYGLSKIERRRGDHDTAIRAMAAAAAMSYFVNSYGISIEEHVHNIEFGHWRDASVLERLGMTRYNYLTDQNAEKEVVAFAKQYLNRLQERAIGGASGTA